jgi:hypothetical protein
MLPCWEQGCLFGQLLARTHRHDSNLFTFLRGRHSRSSAVDLAYYFASWAQRNPIEAYRNVGVNQYRYAESTLSG